MSDYDPQAGRRMPGDPAPGSEQRHHDEEDLQAGLSGLAGIVAGSRGVADLLAQIAGFAAHAVPSADGAGVTLLRPPDAGPPRAQTWGATAEFVQEVDRLQYEVLDEGPCITCTHTGRPVLSGSLGRDERWPRFGGQAAQLGVHSSLSLPLMIDDTVIGALNCYAAVRDAFSEHAVYVGSHFAGPAAVAVHNAQLLTAARARAEQLQAALNSRAVIDQAIGIIRSRSGGSSAEAVMRLKQISQSENVKMSVIAQRMVDEAVRRAQARHTAD